MEVCNCLTIPTAENNAGQLLVVFCVNEFGNYSLLPLVNVLETNFKREKDSVSYICLDGIILTYERTPPICHLY